MSERAPEEVRMFRIDYRCDACGRADMVAVGKVVEGGIKRYVHECKACGATQILRVKYPRMVTRTIKAHAAEATG